MGEESTGERPTEGQTRTVIVTDVDFHVSASTKCPRCGATIQGAKIESGKLTDDETAEQVLDALAVRIHQHQRMHW